MVGLSQSWILDSEHYVEDKNWRAEFLILTFFWSQNSTYYFICTVITSETCMDGGVVAPSGVLFSAPSTTTALPQLELSSVMPSSTLIHHSAVSELFHTAELNCTNTNYTYSKHHASMTLSLFSLSHFQNTGELWQPWIPMMWRLTAHQIFVKLHWKEWRAEPLLEIRVFL